MTDPGVTDLPKANSVKSKWCTQDEADTDCGPQLTATTLGPGSGLSLRRTSEERAQPGSEAPVPAQLCYGQ